MKSIKAEFIKNFILIKAGAYYCIYRQKNFKKYF